MNNCLLTQCRVTPSLPHYGVEKKSTWRQLKLVNVALSHHPVSPTLPLFLAPSPLLSCFLQQINQQPDIMWQCTFGSFFFFAPWQARKLAFHLTKKHCTPYIRGHSSYYEGQRVIGSLCFHFMATNMEQDLVRLFAMFFLFQLHILCGHVLQVWNNCTRKSHY